MTVRTEAMEWHESVLDMFERLEIGAVALDRGAAVLAANDAAAARLGLREGTAGIAELVEGMEADAVRAAVAALCEPGAERSVKVRLAPLPGGEPIPSGKAIAAHIVPSRPDGAMLVLHCAQADGRADILETIDVVRHDFVNLLTSIKGAVHLLGRNNGDPRLVEKVAAELEAVADRGLGSIAMLVEAAKRTGD